jgi:hypothetical protein
MSEQWARGSGRITLGVAGLDATGSADATFGFPAETIQR